MADDERTPDEEFDAAWNEAAGGETPEPRPEPAEPEPEAEPETEEPEPTPDAEPEPEAEPVAAEPEAEATPEEPEEPDWHQRFEELEHKTKSWEGRLKARDREIAELKAELETRDARRDPPEEVDTPALDDVWSEYPDELRASIQQEIDRRVNERMEPLQQRVETVDTESHYGKIADAHDDYQDVASSNEFHDWIDSHPDYLKPGLQQVIAHGTADQVIALLTDYKTARQATLEAQQAEQQRQAQSRKRAQQLNDAAAVRSKPGGIPRGQPDPDDFDAAWAEAIKGN
ncbi:MAG TPA: hypothetical protein VFG60_07130 [Burkholderiaceae bacterium]|nr:hypothetical protein [Burkholderiaceae bacterium]